MCSRLLRTALALVCAAAAGRSQERVTAAEAAKLAFADCKVESADVELSAAQRTAVEKAAGVAAPLRVLRFVATRDGKPAGAAYVDARRVRTHTQQLLIVVDAAGKVARIEVLAWEEPRRYRPRAEFFAQFLDKVLGKDLALGKGVQPVAGATLSARASVDAVRTVLALHALLAPPAVPPPPEPKPDGKEGK